MWRVKRQSRGRKKGKGSDMQRFYIVAKLENGWHNVVATTFKSVEDASRALILLKKCGLKHETKISKKLPTYVGSGFYVLNSSDIVA